MIRYDRFPDGQINPKSHRENWPEISCRLSSWDDFQDMIVAAAQVRNAGMTPILHAPYILGSRSDRDFGGGINYLRDVVAKIINDQGFYYVKTMDPHSLAMEGAIINLIAESPILYIYEHIQSIRDLLTDGGITIVSPDFGAYKKVWEYCEHISSTMGLDIDFISCEKIRNKDGKIVRSRMIGSPKFMNALIIDDICDGGRTFIELSKIMAENGFIGDAHLFVTHGIFSKGLKELGRHFKSIHTTNSVNDDRDYGNHVENFTKYTVI